MRSHWKSWLAGKWYLVVPIGFWILLVGWIIVSFKVNFTFWPANAIIPMYEKGLPIFLGVAALVFAAAIVGLAFARKVPLAAGIVSGAACGLAGISFWYLFGIFIMAV